MVYTGEEIWPDKWDLQMIAQAEKENDGETVAFEDLAHELGVAADEEADDIFCQRMAENYENAPDEDKEEIPLGECLREWGLD